MTRPPRMVAGTVSEVMMGMVVILTPIPALRGVSLVGLVSVCRGASYRLP